MTCNRGHTLGSGDGIFALMNSTMSSSSPQSATTETIPEKGLLFRRYISTDRDAAMKIISEGYAQRRSDANKTIFLHPYFFAVLVPLLGVVFYFYDIVYDLGTVMLLVSGIVMSLMSLVSRFTEPLQELARQVGRGTFLDSSDYAFVAIYGDELVGVCSMQYVELASRDAKDPLALENIIIPSDTASKRKSRQFSKKQFAMLTSWTVVKRYRNVGMGTDLLSYALNVAAQDKSEAIFVQTMNTEKRAHKSLLRYGFAKVAETPLDGRLGSVMKFQTETWSIDPVKWAIENEKKASE